MPLCTRSYPVARRRRWAVPNCAPRWTPVRYSSWASGWRRDPGNLADRAAADEAFSKVGFLVSLEQRMTAVARRADVVFPVAPVVEKAGSFINWEGRLRTFEQVLDAPSMPDARVLDTLAKEF